MAMEPSPRRRLAQHSAGHSTAGSGHTGQPQRTAHPLAASTHPSLMRAPSASCTNRSTSHIPSSNITSILPYATLQAAQERQGQGGGRAVREQAEGGGLVAGWRMHVHGGPAVAGDTANSQRAAAVCLPQLDVFEGPEQVVEQPLAVAAAQRQHRVRRRRLIVHRHVHLCRYRQGSRQRHSIYGAFQSRGRRRFGRRRLGQEQQHNSAQPASLMCPATPACRSANESLSPAVSRLDACEIDSCCLLPTMRRRLEAASHQTTVHTGVSAAGTAGPPVPAANPPQGSV